MYNKIKIFALMIASVLLVAVLFPISAFSADNEVVIVAPEVTAYRGGTVDVVLNVTQNSGFASLLINIANHQGIEPATEVKNGQEVKVVKNGSVLSNMTVGGDVFNILWDSTKSSTTTGAMCTITFKIADDANLGKNEIKVKLKECFGYDEATDTYPEVSVSISNIVINVVEAPSDGTTSTETTPSGTTSTETTPASPNESTGVNNGVNTDAETENNVVSTTDTTDNGDENTAQGSGYNGGCSGAIIAAPIAIASIVGGAFVFRKKH